MADPVLSAPAYTVVVLIFAISYLLYRFALPRPIPGIPYHEKSTWSIWGDIPALQRHRKATSGSTFQWIAMQSYELDSPIFQLFLFPFSAPKVFLTDHREGLDIMLRRSKDFDRSRFFSDNFVGTIPDAHLVLPTNTRFKAQRKLLADTMTPSFLNKVAAKHVRRQALNLVDLWCDKARLADGRCFSVSSDITQMTFGSIWAVAFGTDINAIESQCANLELITSNGGDELAGKDEAVEFARPPLPEAMKAISTLVENMETAAGSPFPRLSHWRKRQTTNWKLAKAYKDKLVQDRLEDAKTRLLRSEAGEDMVRCATDHMVLREQQAATGEGREPQYDTPGAKDDLFLFVLAGYDTTAGAIKWAIKYLADHPSVQSSLRDALHAAFQEDYNNNMIPSGDAIATANLPYMDAFIEEVLRHGSPIGAQVRVVLRDTEILGHRLPKGIDVVTLCRGPGILQPDPFVSRIAEDDRSKTSQSKGKTIPDWNSADIADFKPARWLKGAHFDPQAGPSRQFGAGERGCFGRKLAYLEMRIVIAIVLWSFELPQLPEALSSQSGITKSVREPAQCYARPIKLPLASK